MKHHLGMGKQALHGINTQQLMQKSAVEHIDLGRFHPVLFLVGVVRLQLTDHDVTTMKILHGKMDFHGI